MLRYYSLPLNLISDVEMRIEMAKYTTNISKQDAIKIVLEAGENIIRCASEKKKEVANG